MGITRQQSAINTPGPAMISWRAAKWIAAVGAGSFIGLIVFSVVWGGSVTRCKPNGFVSGVPALATDADCLDTRVLNEFNSQIENTNVKVNAGIAGYKTDGIFSQVTTPGLYSSGQMYFSASNLYSITSFNILASVNVLGSLSVDGLLSLSTEGIRFSDGTVQSTNATLNSSIRLTSVSNVVGGVGTPTPVPRNTLFADNIITAWAVVAGDAIDSPYLRSFGFGDMRRLNTGIYSFRLANTMSSVDYPITPTMNKTGGGVSRNCATATNRTVSFFLISVFNCADGTAQNDGFSVTVVGDAP